MKKIVITSLTALCSFLFISCSNNDAPEFSLEGVWEATEIYYGKQYDFNRDGIFTSNLKDEFPCNYVERLTFNQNGDGFRFISSPLIFVLAPETGYECVPNMDVIRNFTWVYDSANEELTYIMDAQGGFGTYRYQRAGNHIIYTLPVNTVSQLMTGDDTSTDSLTFVFEKIIQ